MKYLYLLISIPVLLFSSCTQTSNKEKDEPVARVYKNYLYESDLEDIIKADISEADSIALVKDYIDNWVFNQLMVHEAELLLNEEEKDVEKQIEDYRNSLLIFKLEQNHIRSNLDTNILKSVIEEYYNQYTSNFILNQHIVKLMLVKLPKNSPSMWRVRSWYHSDKPEDLTKLEQYCFENKGTIQSFDKDWYTFDDIQKLLPDLPYSSDWMLKNKTYFELRDDDSFYLVHIYDYHLAGSISPLEYVEKDIASILMNKQKLELIKKFESEIYNNALNRGNFNIY